MSFQFIIPAIPEERMGFLRDAPTNARRGKNGSIVEQVERALVTGEARLSSFAAVRQRQVVFRPIIAAMIASVITIWAQPSSVGAATISLSPGANIQQAIASHPGGTTFSLTAGLYRQQRLTPLAGDIFIGPSGGGAVLNGSKLVTNWAHSGSYWISSGNPALNSPYGSASIWCQSSSSGCAYPQDLYLNDKPLAHRLALPIVSGQWYFDYTHDQIYMADNPTGQKVELGVTQYAFYGSANNVTVKNLTIEKYAPPLQAGAITMYGAGWIISGNTIRLNHSEGIKVRGNSAQILSNSVYSNSLAGIGVGGSSGTIIQNNQITSNNYAKCSYVQEASGVKIGDSSNVHVVNNTASHNDATGIWVDSQTSGTVITGNTVSGNSQNGIRHEYSSYGTISNNILTNNEQNVSTGACTSNTREIVAADSNHVSIKYNTITSKCAGITLTNGNFRINGANVPVDLVVTDNTTTYTGSTQMPRPIGGQDPESPPPLFNTANNNYFDYNTYHFNSTSLLNLLNWEWGGSLRNWTQWRAAGQDRHGTAN
jgi:parallel beta-helix repeat protein